MKFSVRWSPWPFTSQLSSGEMIKYFEDYDEAKAFFDAELKNPNLREYDGDDAKWSCRQYLLLESEDKQHPFYLRSTSYWIDSLPAYIVLWMTGEGNYIDSLSSGEIIKAFDNLDEAEAFFEDELLNTGMIEVDEYDDIVPEEYYNKQRLCIIETATRKTIDASEYYWI